MRASRVASVGRLLWKGKDRKCGSGEVMVKREAPKITVESVNLKTTGIKKSGAWQYKDNKIQRASGLKLKTNAKGVPYTDDKDPGEERRKHESNFFITINTNKSGGSHATDPLLDTAGREATRKALEELAKDDKICAYIKFGPKSDHYQHDKYEDVITKIEWNAGVECGEKLERIHCHIWLTVHHYSQVQINMPVMQKMFKDIYNSHVPNIHKSYQIRRQPYIQVKLLPTSDWAMVIKQYMHKAMTGGG